VKNSSISTEMYWNRNSTDVANNRTRFCFLF